MLRHNIKLAFRNFKKDKSTFSINLIGLSIGLACAIMIFMWVNDEVNVDKFHSKSDQLYQAMINHHLADEIITGEFTQALLGDALLAEIPEVEMAVTSSEAIPTPFILDNGNQKIKAYGQFSGADFFKLFNYDFLEGDRNTMLNNKTSIVISDALAMKLFKTTSAIGKVLNWQLLHFEGEVTVTGVFKEIGNYSTSQFDLILPFPIFADLLGPSINWDNFNTQTAVRLQANTDIEKLNNTLTNFIKTKNERTNTTLFLKPYAEKYLHGKYENGKLAGGRIEYVRLFSIIALFILIIACINFMNLSTAKATRKLKEIGVRKTIGANRQSLIGQYLGESILTAFLALLMAVVLVHLILPSFNSLTGKELSFPWQLPMISALLGLTVFTGIFAGSYPALYLSGFHPAKTLKNSIGKSSGSVLVRKGLVIFQFTLSVIFIVAVSVIYQQINFIQTKNLGYNRDNIITFSKEGKAGTDIESFLTQLKNVPGIVNASGTQHTIVAGGSTTSGLHWEGKNPEDMIQFTNMTVFYDYVETMQIEQLEGRSFSKEFGTEEGNLILNETAIKRMGITDPVGKTIRLWGEDAKIIGVVKDFNFESLHKKVEPMFLMLAPEYLMTIVARIEAGRERETISRLEEFYKTHNTGYTLNYNFLDAKYDAEYKAEARVSILSRYFAGLAIFISCLGLFGLAAFTVQRRMKEISIRKVLGASVFGLVSLLSKNFLVLVLLAFLLASPIAYFLMENWLNAFAYRIDIPWAIFMWTGIIIISITFLIVSFHITKAAFVNPVESLKSEE